MKMMMPYSTNVSQTLDTDNETSFNWSTFMMDGTGQGLTGTLVRFVNHYVAPIIVVLGLIGNIISLIVFSERTMQRRSSSVYLVALSAVDVVFLTCVLLSWTAETPINLYCINGPCQMFTYVTHVSSFLGVWYVVGFTVERYVAVHYPLRRQSVCTAAKARRVVLSLAGFAALLYSFSFWMYGVIKYDVPVPSGVLHHSVCGPLLQYVFALTVVYPVDTVITLFLPFVIITVLNLRIAITVFRCNRTRQNMTRLLCTGDTTTSCAAANNRRMGDDSTSGNSQMHRLAMTGVRGHHDLLSSTNSDQFRVIKLPLTVSVTFLVLNLPRHAARSYQLVIELVYQRNVSMTLLVCQKLFQVMYYLQFAINMVLYATIERSIFRGALRRVARRARRKMTNASIGIQLPLTAVRRVPNCWTCTYAVTPEIDGDRYCEKRNRQNRLNCFLHIMPRHSQPSVYQPALETRN